MRSVIIYVAVCLLLSAYNTVNAQHSYRFEATTGTYTELQSAQRISWKRFEQVSDFYRLNELKGETFRWYGINFPIDDIKTFHIQPNGNLRFDNDSTLMIVDAAFTYLDSIDNSSSISYTIEGAAGDKLIKAQWKNVKLRVGQAGNYANFQIWVYQKSGIIEIHYGPRSANNQSGFNTTSGPQVGMFWSEDDFSKCYEKLWVNGSPSAYTLDSNANFVFKAMSGVMDDGNVFRFIPRFRTLGLKQHNTHTNTLLLYPNPVAGGVLYVSEPGNYIITDACGREVLSVYDTEQIDVGNLPKGLYHLRSQHGGKSFIVE